MGITYITNTTNMCGNCSSIVGSIPGAATTTGDLMIAITTLSRGGTSDMILPSGWTNINNGIFSNGGWTCISQLSYRVVEAGDTSWTWTSNYTNLVYGVCILSYNGQSTKNLINGVGKNEGYGATVVAPSIPYTLVNQNSLIIQSAAMSSGTLSSPPPALSQRVNMGGSSCYALGDRNISGGGDTGTATWSASPQNPSVAITAVINAESSFVPSAVII